MPVWSLDRPSFECLPFGILFWLLGSHWNGSGTNIGNACTNLQTRHKPGSWLLDQYAHRNGTTWPADDEFVSQLSEMVVHGEENGLCNLSFQGQSWNDHCTEDERGPHQLNDPDWRMWRRSIVPMPLFLAMQTTYLALLSQTPKTPDFAHIDACSFTPVTSSTQPDASSSIWADVLFYCRLVPWQTLRVYSTMISGWWRQCSILSSQIH